MNPQALTIDDLTQDLPPLVRDWLKNSKDQLAEKWRDFLRAEKIYRMDQARKRQKMIHEHVLSQSDPNDKKCKIRRIGIVDPEIMDEFRGKYGNDCFSDPEFVKDTKKKAPELFVPE